MSNKIVVVGSSNIDMVIKGDKIPRPGETVIGGDFFKAAGGKGANQAVAAARAGGQVSFISSVGNDIFGKEAISNYREDGIDSRAIKTDPEHATGTALILIDKDGENSISVAPGANNSLNKTDLEKASAVIQGASVLLVQLEIPIETVEAAVQMANSFDVKVVLNPAPARHLSDQLLKQISIITPNESEAEHLTGIPINNFEDAKKAARILLKKGVETVLITLGKKGTLLTTHNTSELIPAFEVDTVDTTAAGDVFNGALATAISEGMSLKEAIRFANAAAAISVTRLGAQPSAPKREEIENFLINHYQ